MNYEFTGKLHVVMDTQKVSEKFQKREFVLFKREDKGTWTSEEHVKFQLTQDRCDVMDGFKVGEELKVSFNIRGREWEKEGRTSYFTNLEAWRIERMGEQPIAEAPKPMEKIETVAAGAKGPDDFADDLPF